MSVPVGDRKEGKLQVLNECKKLIIYTLAIIKNEKIFPKSSRWVLANDIRTEAMAAFLCIRRANATYVSSKETFAYRSGQQHEAHAHLDGLLSLMDLAYNIYSIDGRKISYWTGLVLKTDDLLKSWIRSDKIRNVDYCG